MDVNSLTYEQRFALLYGILLGDGCISRYKTKDGRERKIIVVTCSYRDDAEFFDKIVAPLFCSFTGHLPKVKLRPKYGARDIFVSNKELFAKIESLGFTVGKKKDIPIPSLFGEDLIKFVKKVASELLDDKYGDGFNLVMNNLAVAGQVVMHAHIHVIPRKENDGLRFLTRV